MLIKVDWQIIIPSHNLHDNKFGRSGLRYKIIGPVLSCMGGFLFAFLYYLLKQIVAANLNGLHHHITK